MIVAAGRQNHARGRLWMPACGKPRKEAFTRAPTLPAPVRRMHPAGKAG
jgi:hypothetical protein